MKVLGAASNAEAASLDLVSERSNSEANGIKFLSVSIVDRGIPKSDETIRGIISQLDLDLAQGKNAVIHCRQGIGRACMIGAVILIEAGLSSDDAIRKVTLARGLPIPETDEQRVWIESFASTLAPKI